MSTKHNNEGTTAERRDIIPGDRLTIGGVEFAVLDKDEDGNLFVVAVQNQFMSRFGVTNNFITSDLWKATGEWREQWVSNNNLNWEHILLREIDLTTADGYRYGKTKVLTAPLTLDEVREYGDILPASDSWSWLATGWDRPSLEETYVLCTNDNGGLGLCQCFYAIGVRPAMLISPELVKD